MPRYILNLPEDENEAADMLQQLAEMDMRSIGKETAWLIRQEWARRYSHPSPLTLGEAVQAGQAINTPSVEPK